MNNNLETELQALNDKELYPKSGGGTQLVNPGPVHTSELGCQVKWGAKLDGKY